MLRLWRVQSAMLALSAALAVLTVPAASATTGTWSQSTPTGTAPDARYNAGSAYDATNDRLILFGGEQAYVPPFNPFVARPPDVWVLANATGIGGASSWSQLAPTGGPPYPRFANSVVYAPTQNEIIVYGGCPDNCGFALSDTWVLTNADGTCGTPAWSQLPAVGGDNRENHAAVYDDANNRMIVFGGQHGFNSYACCPQVRVLANADGSGVGTPTWTTLAPVGTAPSAREASAVAYDSANDRMIVFGGLSVVCCAFVSATYNDVWVLTNANGLGGAPVWTQLAPTGTPPPARGGATAVYDAASNRLIVFGGSNPIPPPAEGTFYNDVWVLTNANGIGGTPTWIQLAPPGGPPSARVGHSAGYNPTYDAMVVAMGRNDVPSYTLYDDVWVLGNANGAFDFSGFFSPVDHPPVVNGGRAGSAIPVKFSLDGDQGLDVFAPGYPKSQQVACDASVPSDGIEETVTAGSSGLSYDPATDNYVYVWKTAKAWAGTCRKLTVRLVDGTDHVAHFSFK